MVALLTGAAAVALAFGEAREAALIAAIVLANAALGYVQEDRAEQATSALRRLVRGHARVVRDGRALVVDAEAVVRGDVVLLEAGDRVPADLRLDETLGLETDESTLTGESVTVAKDAAAREDPEAPLAERPWFAFAGTMAARGTGRGTVVATAAATEVGRLVASVPEERPRTPLQVRLDRLAVTLLRVSVACGAVLGLLAWRSGEAPDTSAAHRRLARRRRGAGGPARRGDRHPRARRAPHGRVRGGGAPPARGGDARLDHDRLLRQDRHADREPDGAPGLRGRGPRRRAGRRPAGVRPRGGRRPRAGGGGHRGRGEGPRARPRDPAGGAGGRDRRAVRPPDPAHGGHGRRSGRRPHGVRQGRAGRAAARRRRPGGPAAPRRGGRALRGGGPAAAAGGKRAHGRRARGGGPGGAARPATARGGREPARRPPRRRPDPDDHGRPSRDGARDRPRARARCGRRRRGPHGRRRRRPRRRRPRRPPAPRRRSSRASSRATSCGWCARCRLRARRSP